MKVRGQVFILAQQFDRATRQAEITLYCIPTYKLTIVITFTMAVSLRRWRSTQGPVPM